MSKKQTNSPGDYKEAALYIRVSTGKQEELSPDAQKRLGLDWAKKNKVIIRPEHIFIENGISGREVKKRPEFQRMIGMAKAKPAPFQMILVWKFSRFARNQEESIVYKSLLKKQCGVDVISISEPLIDGPFGSLIERIIEWMDEYYSIRLAGEVTRGMTEKALRGGYQSTPPLGYDAVGEGRPFVINEEDFKSVNFIFQSAVKRMNPTEIARQLNDMGKRTRRGTLFEKRSITYILRNPFYIGKLIWNDIEREGTHETRISKEVFEDVQKYLDSMYQPVKRRHIGSCKHWLSGLLKCSICGASLAYNAHGDRGTKYFNCWKYAKGFHRGSSSIVAKKAEQAVIMYFEQLLAGEDFTFTYRPIEHTDESLQLDEYKKELEKIQSRELRIKLAYENEIDTLEEYKENKARLQSDRERIESLISNLETSQKSPGKEDVLKTIHAVLDIIKDEEVDYEVKGTFIRSVVEEIIFDRETETFTFCLYSSD